MSEQDQSEFEGESSSEEDEALKTVKFLLIMPLIEKPHPARNF